MNQYPYTLQVLKKTDASQDASGNWTNVSENWVDHSKCRDEDGRGRQVKGADGNLVVVGFVIQCPRGISVIDSGTIIRILDESGATRVSGTVLYGQKDRLHTRIWV